MVSRSPKMTAVAPRPYPPQRPRFTTAPPDLPVSVIVAQIVRDSGLTHEALARRLQMSRRAVTDRLLGRTRWTAEELPPLAHLLGVTVASLYGEEPS